MSELLLPEIEPTRLPVEEVLAIQNLAMSAVRNQARRPDRTQRAPRRHGFTLYRDSGGRVGSGEIDTFMTVRVARQDFRQWMMKIAFRELQLTHERRYSNYLEEYTFSWVGKEHCWGDKRTVETFHRIIDTFHNPETQTITDFTQLSRSIATYPLEVEDCDVLTNRMLEIVATPSIRAA
jgi:hypothetical protein